MKLLPLSLAAVAALAWAADPKPSPPKSHDDPVVPVEPVPDSLVEVTADTILRLTEDDYQEVARELGVEPAAIKAVVDIEAGPGHQGFFKPGLPLVNFDLSMFRQRARHNHVNLSRYSRSHTIVFAAPNARRYGSRQAAQQERLRQARTIHEVSAIEGTFWGMFQIGGFNWKLCGCSDIYEFVHRMSTSEREQLELFAAFIRNIGLDKALRDKNWAAFARRYNGASYATRGYHTRMANAYRRHKAREGK